MNIKNKKILIFEDELIIAKVLSMQFKQLDNEVRISSEAFDIVELVKEFKPDYIILDVFLKKGSNGIEAGNNLRKAGVLTPIVFTTGNAYESTLKEISNIENAKLISKPAEFEVIVSKLKEF